MWFIIEETGSSGRESTEEISVMEVSNSHEEVRRSRDKDETSSGNGKRRRLDPQDQHNIFQLQYQSRRDFDVNFLENVVLTGVSSASDHISSFMSSINHDSRSDLKADQCPSETEIFMSSNDGFRETSASIVVSLESKEMESLSTSTPKKCKPAAANEATSRHKPSAPPPAKSPSLAELEEFFSEAEKYEQKRFAEKYNYDIVKDVPMEGRYQWGRLKP